jgi:hypothetical protein
LTQCLRGTLIGSVAAQGKEYTENVNTAYFVSGARAPQWIMLSGDSKATARTAVAAYMSTLRHGLGMHAVQFVLASYPGGTLFALVYSHMFLEAGSREMLQDAASALYHRPETVVQRHGTGAWARYVKYAMGLRTDEVFWQKEFARCAALPSFHTARLGGSDGEVAVKSLFADGLKAFK